jgi:hypothetical protein
MPSCSICGVRRLKEGYVLSKSKISCEKCLQNICFKCDDAFSDKYHTITNKCVRDGKDTSVNRKMTVKFLVCDDCNKKITYKKTCGKHSVRRAYATTFSAGGVSTPYCETVKIKR